MNDVDVSVGVISNGVKTGVAEVKNEITRSVVITMTIAAILLCRRRLPAKQQ